jgi:hypothetical protein
MQDENQSRQKQQHNEQQPNTGKEGAVNLVDHVDDRPWDLVGGNPQKP